MVAINLVAILWPVRPHRATRPDARTERGLAKKKERLCLAGNRKSNWRLANLWLAPMREATIVEELAQHLDDCYAERLASGATEAEACK